MLRKILLGTGAVALGVGSAIGTGGAIASATKTPVQLTGSIACSVTGSLKFSPKLTNGGSGAEIVTLKARLTGCSGTGGSGGGVTLSGGNLTAATSGPFTSNCGPILSGSSLPTFSGIVKWKGTGGHIVTSNISVSSADVFYDSGSDTLTTYLTTVTVSSGSYTGEHMHFGNLVATKDALKTATSCGAAGIASIKSDAAGGTASVGA